MDTEPQIVFEHMAASESLRTLILDELGKLEKFFGRIIAARVVVNAPPRERGKDYMFCTSVHLTLPGGRDVAVSQEPNSGRHYETAQAAIRDACDAARRRLQDEVRLMEGRVKAHSERAEQLGRVARLMTEDGFGFIETDGGHEVFFTRAKVKHKAFNSLKVGAAVYFNEEMGSSGPVATSVRLAPSNAEASAPSLNSPDRV